MTDYSWTDDRVERLRSLWSDHTMSARMIGEELGCTRNAVLGKAFRLLLPAKKTVKVSRLATRIEGRRVMERSRPKPQPKSIVVATKYFEGSRPLRPAPVEFKAPVVSRGTSKTSPGYRNQLGFLPDLTVRQRRDMLAEAVRNTAAMPVEG
jgi:GcrA cell cycle regulator